METIRSRKNTLVKRLVRLAGNRRERRRLGCALLSGSHLVLAARQNGWRIEHLFVREGTMTPELEQLLGEGIGPCTTLSTALFDAIEGMPSPTPVLAIVAHPPQPDVRHDGFCVLLDNVQDPGNVGSILRSAAASGVDQVWLTAGCADAWSPKVLRAGMGAHFTVPVIERIDACAALDAFGGRCVATASQGTESIYDACLDGDLVLALGSEGQGLAAEITTRAAQRLRIPMRSGVESLNVAAAAAVCLFERQRRDADTPPR